MEINGKALSTSIVSFTICLAIIDVFLYNRLMKFDIQSLNFPVLIVPVVVSLLSSIITFLAISHTRITSDLRGQLLFLPNIAIEKSSKMLIIVYSFQVETAKYKPTISKISLATPFTIESYPKDEKGYIIIYGFKKDEIKERMQIIENFLITWSNEWTRLTGNKLKNYFCSHNINHELQYRPWKVFEINCSEDLNISISSLINISKSEDLSTFRIKILSPFVTKEILYNSKYEEKKEKKKLGFSSLYLIIEKNIASSENLNNKHSRNLTLRFPLRFRNQLTKTKVFELLIDSINILQRYTNNLEKHNTELISNKHSNEEKSNENQPRKLSKKDNPFNIEKKHIHSNARSSTTTIKKIKYNNETPIKRSLNIDEKKIEHLLLSRKQDPVLNHENNLHIKNKENSSDFSSLDRRGQIFDLTLLDSTFCQRFCSLDVRLATGEDKCTERLYIAYCYLEDLEASGSRIPSTNCEEELDAFIEREREKRKDIYWPCVLALLETGKFSNQTNNGDCIIEGCKKL